MLRRMTPRQFDEWMIMHSIEPWGDDWAQASSIAAAVINEIRCQLNKDIKNEDLLKLDALVPRPTEESVEAPNLNQSLLAFRGIAGV